MEKEELIKFIEILNKYGMTYDPNIRDYTNDPIIIERRERAKEVIKKCGIPEGCY